MSSAETIIDVSKLVKAIMGHIGLDECFGESIAVFIFLVGAVIDIFCLINDGLFWGDVNSKLDVQELLHTPPLDESVELLHDSIIGVSLILFVEIVIGLVAVFVEMSEAKQLLVKGVTWFFAVLEFIIGEFIATIAFLRIVNEGAEQGVDFLKSKDGVLLAVSLIVSAVWTLPKTVVNFCRIILASINRNNRMICFIGTCLAIVQNIATYAFLIVTTSELKKMKNDFELLEIMYNIYKFLLWLLSVMFGINVICGFLCLCFCNNVLRTRAWNDEIVWRKEEHIILYCLCESCCRD